MAIERGSTSFCEVETLGHDLGVVVGGIDIPSVSMSVAWLVALMSVSMTAGP